MLIQEFIISNWTIVHRRVSNTKLTRSSDNLNRKLCKCCKLFNNVKVLCYVCHIYEEDSGLRG